MGDTVLITSGTYQLALHRCAISELTVGRLKKIMNIMLKARWENEEAVGTVHAWLLEDAATRKGTVADAQKDLDDYWHPGLVKDKKVRLLRRELNKAKRDLERAQKLLDHFESERKKYYGNYNYD